MAKKSGKKIYLASTSPRRHGLLKDVGYSFEILNPDTDEAEIAGESPRAMVARLAREKARAGKSLIGKRAGEAVIIAADTTVVAPGGKRILGKPRDASEARRMLALLSGREHTVLTGYCVLSSEEHVRVVTTRVRMRKLTAAAIARYVESKEPMDKAGAYAAQGIGMCLIESIRGSYSNVVGLPMAELVADLQDRFACPPNWKP